MLFSFLPLFLKINIVRVIQYVVGMLASESSGKKSNSNCMECGDGTGCNTLVVLNTFRSLFLVESLFLPFSIICG